jgi:hypothetical protein
MEEEPEKDLWRAVIETALEDRRNYRMRQEVDFFFRSEWFNEIASYIDLDVDAFKERMNTIRREKR